LNNIIGLGISVVYVFVIIGIVYIIKTKTTLPLIYRRKIVHIAISNWWIIAMVFFDHVVYASIIPLILLILNYASTNLKILEEVDEIGTSYGIIYYPLSMLILVILFFGFIKAPYIGLVGALIMGYGDGLAGIVGQLFGKTKHSFQKTWIGSLVMFVTSLIITLFVDLLYESDHLILSIVLVPLLATLLEAIGEKGLDNLTVPIGSSLLFLLLQLL
jgi:phytol kinase